MTVRIVNQRIKTGWVDGALYLEVHHPLDGTDPKDVEDLTALTRAIVAATAERRVIVDWDAAERVFEEARGEPTRISVDRWIAPRTAVAHRRIAAMKNAAGSPRRSSASNSFDDLLRNRLLEHAVDLLVDRLDGRRIRLCSRQRLIGGALRAGGRGGGSWQPRSSRRRHRSTPSPCRPTIC